MWGNTWQSTRAAAGGLGSGMAEAVQNESAGRAGAQAAHAKGLRGGDPGALASDLEPIRYKAEESEDQGRRHGEGEVPGRCLRGGSGSWKWEYPLGGGPATESPGPQSPPPSVEVAFRALQQSGRTGVVR